MFDFGRIAGFGWDQGNTRKRVAKHGVDQSEAEQVFFGEPAVITDEARHNHDEPRFHALGRSDADRLLHVTFTLRRARTLIRVISASDMRRKERSRHAEDT